jgi:hypothetical protein
MTPDQLELNRAMCEVISALSDDKWEAVVGILRNGRVPPAMEERMPSLIRRLMLARGLMLIEDLDVRLGIQGEEALQDDVRTLRQDIERLKKGR